MWIWEEADVCKNRAELLKNFKNEYSEKRPLNIANGYKRAPGGVRRALPGRVGLTQKNFFFKK